MLLSDDRAVWLTERQHEELLVEFAEALRPINRRLRWGFTLAIPAMLVTLAIVARTGAASVMDALAGPLSIAAGVACLCWWPFLVLAYHWRSVRNLNRAVDALLADLPVAPAPPRQPVALQTIEIVALFVIGPGIVFDVSGSLFPHLFDGTPLMGRSIGPLTLVGLAILAFGVARNGIPFRRGQRTHPAPVEELAPREPQSRSRDIISRARASLD